MAKKKHFGHNGASWWWRDGLIGQMAEHDKKAWEIWWDTLPQEQKQIYEIGYNKMLEREHENRGGCVTVLMIWILIFGSMIIAGALLQPIFGKTAKYIVLVIPSFIVTVAVFQYSRERLIEAGFEESKWFKRYDKILKVYTTIINLGPVKHSPKSEEELAYDKLEEAYEEYSEKIKEDMLIEDLKVAAFVSLATIGIATGHIGLAKVGANIAEGTLGGADIVRAAVGVDALDGIATATDIADAIDATDVVTATPDIADAVDSAAYTEHLDDTMADMGFAADAGVVDYNDSNGGLHTETYYHDAAGNTVVTDAAGNTVVVDNAGVIHDGGTVGYVDNNSITGEAKIVGDNGETIKVRDGYGVDSNGDLAYELKKHV